MSLIHSDHVFFDLDHTLWDFEKNSYEALSELYSSKVLSSRGIDTFESFMSCYREHNDKLWALYREDKIRKEDLRVERFRRTFHQFGIRDEVLSNDMATEYLESSPYKKNLFPKALKTLDHLRERYALHIITNGFEEVQNIKLRESGLDVYFKQIVTSEKAGCRKPDPGIFEFALSNSGALPGRSAMVGDKPEVDLDVPGELGMKTFHFDPLGICEEGNGHTVIRELWELTGHL